MRRRSTGLVKAGLVHLQAATWTVLGSRSETGVRILNYHNVGPASDQLTVAPSRFLRQLELIEEVGLPVVDLRELLDPDKPHDSNVLVITFDDGYRDLLEYAIPAIEKRGWPATVFVVPGAADGYVRYPWYGADQAVISWDEMREVEARGFIRFEPHTLTHPDLPALDAASAEREIRGSKDAVEAALGRPSRSFCYPGGFFGQREVDLVARAGFVCAVSCEYGVNRRPWNPYALRRIPVDRYDTHRLFSARLRGATDRPPFGRSERQSSLHPAG